MLKTEKSELIRSILIRQIAGNIDSMRSKEYWLHILKTAPDEDIAEILSSELTHFNYQKVSAKY